MRLFTIWAALGVLMAPATGHALTMGQFASACEAFDGDCSKSPFLQAYVGGALDFVAMLDEETDYLDRIYCRKASEFFDAPEIIRYMLAHQSGYDDKNAMLLVIRYLEEMGGCETQSERQRHHDLTLLERSDESACSERWVHRASAVACQSDGKSTIIVARDLGIVDTRDGSSV